MAGCTALVCSCARLSHFTAVTPADRDRRRKWPRARSAVLVVACTAPCGSATSPRAKLVRVRSWFRAIELWLSRGPSVAAVLLLTALVACGNPELVSPPTTPTAPPEASPAPGQATYKVGLLASLTGPYATRGISAQNAVRLAAQQVNASGGVGGHTIELLVEDDRAMRVRRSSH
jgi:hypothetical protein